MIFRTLALAYRGKYLPIGRTSFRKVLARGRAQKSPEILLPPYISIAVRITQLTVRSCG